MPQINVLQVLTWQTVFMVLVNTLKLKHLPNKLTRYSSMNIVTPKIMIVVRQSWITSAHARDFGAEIRFCRLLVMICSVRSTLWLSPVSAKIRTLERNGFILIFKFTYRNNKKYSTWHVNCRGRSYLWWFAKLECMLGTSRNTRWVSFKSCNSSRWIRCI